MEEKQVLNKEAWREIYRIECTIERLRRLLRRQQSENVKYDEEQQSYSASESESVAAIKQQLHELRCDLRHLKMENPTEPQGQDLLEVLEGLKEELSSSTT